MDNRNSNEQFQPVVSTGYSSQPSSELNGVPEQTTPPATLEQTTPPATLEQTTPPATPVQTPQRHEYHTAEQKEQIMKVLNRYSVIHITCIVLLVLSIIAVFCLFGYILYEVNQPYVKGEENFLIKIVISFAFLAICGLTMSFVNKKWAKYFKKEFLTPILEKAMGYQATETHVFENNPIIKQAITDLKLGPYNSKIESSDCFVGSVKNFNDEPVKFLFLDTRLSHTEKRRTSSGSSSQSIVDFMGQIYIIPMPNASDKPFSVRLKQIYDPTPVENCCPDYDLDSICASVAFKDIYDILKNDKEDYVPPCSCLKDGHFTPEFYTALNQLSAHATGLQKIAYCNNLLVIISPNSFDYFEPSSSDQKKGYDVMVTRMENEAQTIVRHVEPFSENGVI